MGSLDMTISVTTDNCVGYLNSQTIIECAMRCLFYENKFALADSSAALCASVSASVMLLYDDVVVGA